MSDGLREELKDRPGKGLKDPYDFSDRYNTRLSAAEEKRFLKSSMASDVYDYDSRGEWKAIEDGELPRRKPGEHGTDKYKKPNHPTFSDESIYHGRDGYEGGHWEKGDDGKTRFRVGKTNMMSKAALRGYMEQREPDVELIDEREEK